MSRLYLESTFDGKKFLEFFRKKGPTANETTGLVLESLFDFVDGEFPILSVDYRNCKRQGVLVTKYSRRKEPGGQSAVSSRIRSQFGNGIKIHLRIFAGLAMLRGIYPTHGEKLMFFS